MIILKSLEPSLAQCNLVCVFVEINTFKLISGGSLIVNYLYNFEQLLDLYRACKMIGWTSVPSGSTVAEFQGKELGERSPRHPGGPCRWPRKVLEGQGTDCENRSRLKRATWLPSISKELGRLEHSA